MPNLSHLSIEEHPMGAFFPGEFPFGMWLSSLEASFDPSENHVLPDLKDLRNQVETRILRILRDVILSRSIISPNLSILRYSCFLRDFSPPGRPAQTLWRLFRRQERLQLKLLLGRRSCLGAHKYDHPQDICSHINFRVPISRITVLQ